MACIILTSVPYLILTKDCVNKNNHLKTLLLVFDAGLFSVQCATSDSDKITCDIWLQQAAVDIGSVSTTLQLIFGVYGSSAPVVGGDARELPL